MEVTAIEPRPSAETMAFTDGRLELSVLADAGGAVVKRLFQRTPLRALFPRPEHGEPLTAVLVNSSGGVVGGDRLAVNIEAGDGASIVVIGQAAEKVYRSKGPEARTATTLTAGPGAWVEYLPQGTIVFNGARFRRTTTIDASPDARVMAGEALSLGRVARGERFTSGLLHDGWRVRVDGRLTWADALHLSNADGDDITSALDSTAGFAGMCGYATFIYAAPDAAERLVAARRLLEDRPGSVRAGATSFDGILLARWLGPDPGAVRGALGRFWARFRAEAGGLPERLPAIWNA